MLVSLYHFHKQLYNQPVLSSQKCNVSSLLLSDGNGAAGSISCSIFHTFPLVSIPFPSRFHRLLSAFIRLLLLLPMFSLLLQFSPRLLLIRLVPIRTPLLPPVSVIKPYLTPSFRSASAFIRSYISSSHLLSSSVLSKIVTLPGLTPPARLHASSQISFVMP